MVLLGCGAAGTASPVAQRYSLEARAADVQYAADSANFVSVSPGAQQAIGPGYRVRALDSGIGLLKLGCKSVLLYSNSQVSLSPDSQPNPITKALLLISNTCGDLRVTTDPPEAVITSQGTILFVAFDSQKHTTLLWTLEGTATLADTHGDSQPVPDGKWSVTRDGAPPEKPRPVSEMGDIVKELDFQSTYDDAVHTMTTAGFPPAAAGPIAVATIGERPVAVATPTAAVTPAAPSPTAAATGTAVPTAMKGAVWSPNGMRVATVSTTAASVWDASTGKLLQTLPGHAYDAGSIAWSPDGKQLAVPGAGYTVGVWDAATGKQRFTLEGHGGSINRIGWSPDSKRLATASGDYAARIWDASSGMQLKMLPHANVVTWLAWSPDGKEVATASWDNTAVVWDVSTGQSLRILKGHTNWVLSVAWSPDGKRIITGSDDGTARVWDATKGETITKLQGHESAVTSALWSPDGKYIMTTSRDATARVWQGTTGAGLTVLKMSRDVVGADWSPDSRQIVTADLDGTARIWDALTGASLHVLQGHTGAVNQAAWSPDGKRIVTASDDGSARVWDASTGRQVLILQ